MNIFMGAPYRDGDCRLAVVSISRVRQCLHHIDYRSGQAQRHVGLMSADATHELRALPIIDTHHVNGCFHDRASG